MQKHQFLKAILAFLMISLPGLTFAGLVPCSGTDCTSCDLIVLAQNIFRFVLEISFAIIALFVVIGGIKLLLAAGNPGNIKSAKDMIQGAIVGLIIILCSWLIVNTVLYFLSGGAPGEWWKIEC